MSAQAVEQKRSNLEGQVAKTLNEQREQNLKRFEAIEGMKSKIIELNSYTTSYQHTVILGSGETLMVPDRVYEILLLLFKELEVEKVVIKFKNSCSIMSMKSLIKNLVILLTYINFLDASSPRGEFLLNSIIYFLRSVFNCRRESIKSAFIRLPLNNTPQIQINAPGL